MKTRVIIILLNIIPLSIISQEVSNVFSIIKSGVWNKDEITYLTSDFYIKLHDSINAEDYFNNKNGFSIIQKKEKYNIFHIHSNNEFDAIKDEKDIVNKLPVIGYQPYIVYSDKNSQEKYINDVLKLNYSFYQKTTKDSEIPCMTDERVPPMQVTSYHIQAIEECQDLFALLGEISKYELLSIAIEGYNEYELQNNFLSLADLPLPIEGASFNSILPEYTYMYYIGDQLLSYTSVNQPFSYQEAYHFVKSLCDLTTIPKASILLTSTSPMVIFNNIFMEVAWQLIDQPISYFLSCVDYQSLRGLIESNNAIEMLENTETGYAGTCNLGYTKFYKHNWGMYPEKYLRVNLYFNEDDNEYYIILNYDVDFESPEIGDVDYIIMRFTIKRNDPAYDRVYWHVWDATSTGWQPQHPVEVITIDGNEIDNLDEGNFYVDFTFIDKWWGINGGVWPRWNYTDITPWQSNESFWIPFNEDWNITPSYPIIDIANPEDGAFISTPQVNLFGTVDYSSEICGREILSVMAKNNGSSWINLNYSEPNFTGTINLVNGLNNIEVKATDDQGETGTSEITVTTDACSIINGFVEPESGQSDIIREFNIDYYYYFYPFIEPEFVNLVFDDETFQMQGQSSGDYTMHFTYTTQPNQFNEGYHHYHFEAMQGTDNLRYPSGDEEIELFIDPLPKYVNAKVYLEGPYLSQNMTNSLSDEELLPIDQPFDKFPWYYFGTESTINLTENSIVDWVLLELRDSEDANSAFDAAPKVRQACLLLDDGTIINKNGSENIQFSLLIENELYLAIWHRNHLGILSSQPLIKVNNKYPVDFTVNENTIFLGEDGYSQLDNGKWGMVAGDANSDAIIDVHDIDLSWKSEAGENGYLNSDFDFDGQTNNVDKNDFIYENSGKFSQLPKFICGENFVDKRDGKLYHTIQIGDQCWFKENLNFNTINSWCYDDNISNCINKGRLYDWQSAIEACPKGWHLATDDDWKILEGYADSYFDIGDDEWNKVGERGNDAGLNLRSESCWVGNDLFGFSLLGAGMRFPDPDGSYAWEDYSEHWTSTKGIDILEGIYRRIHFYPSGRYDNNLMGYGFSARCINDQSKDIINSIKISENYYVTQTSIFCNATIFNDGGYAVEDRGICWNIETNPTLINNYISLGNGFGEFSGVLEGLNKNTVYYLRAYAIRNGETIYGNQVHVKTLNGQPCQDISYVDYGGQRYNTIKIGDQCWIKENMDVGKMTNIEIGQTNNGIIEKYCYNNLEINCELFGGLYNWDEMMQYSSIQGTQGICPSGWHIPTDSEFKILEGTCDSQFGVGDPIWNIFDDDRGSDVAYKLKTTNGWMWSATTNGNDSLGFSSLPTGSFIFEATSNGASIFYGMYNNGLYWTSTNYDPSGNGGTNPIFRMLYSSSNQINRGYWVDEKDGNSVRCLKNTDLSTVLTGSINNITYTSVNLTGEIVNIGSSIIEQYGHCWSTSPNPTILNDKTDLGTIDSLTVFNDDITGLVPGTTYYIKTYATNNSGTSYGNEVTFTTIQPNIPSLTTEGVTNITNTTATSGGNVINDGGSPVTAYGVCWSISQNPTILDAHTIEGSGVGLFISNISGLDQGTLYYLSAYATNSVGTAYGNEISFSTLGEDTLQCGTQITDIDGNQYNTVLIGNQCWMAENIKTTKDFAGNSIIRHCINNDTNYCNIYGGLYDWSTIMNGAVSSNTNPSGVQGICPDGWHIPSRSEWDELEEYLVTNFIGITEDNVANKLKSCRQVNSPLGGGCNTTDHPRWNESLTNYGTNEFGMGILPAGNWYPNYNWVLDVGSFSYMWTSTENGSMTVATGVSYNYGFLMSLGIGVTHGLSIRCVRD
ncbi:MAG: hypothetical protein KQI35_17305 [Bacteroidetes bacterium]|nr:hypothetical protein [Bacteroidota bacterium]